MGYATFRPSSELAPFIESFWIQENLTDAAVHDFPPTRVLPTGFVDIAFYYLDPFQCVNDDVRRRLTSVVVTGPQTTFRRYAATGRTGIVIARFWPGAASVFFPQPLHELRDLNAGLADLIGPSGVEEITERLQETPAAREKVAHVAAFLKARLRRDRACADVRTAVNQIIALGGRCSVRGLARLLHLSSRQLERRFRQHVGIGPKTLGRIARFQRAIEIHDSGLSWAMTAHSAGYQDQSHLVNESRALSGLTPVEVHARRRYTALGEFFNSGSGRSPICRTLYV
jgi:AraC-like DNA-binding protein